MSSYSFESVVGSISGPNGNFDLANGSAEGGITVSMRGPKNTLTIGAGGSGMNSLHADKSATITVRVLKTSILNSQLNSMYSSDSSGPSTWGQNVVTFRDVNRGDHITARGCAFQKHPDVMYDKEGQTLEWTLDAAHCDILLGSGTPTLSIAGI